MAQRRRVLQGVALALVVLLFVVVGLVVWTVRRSFPQTSGELTLPVLDQPVEVVRDRYGIPNIYADSALDLFRAQGYVHAQDRFFEMDFRRHVTAGRLSELFGKTTLDADRFVRTMGWRRVAEQEWEQLPDSSRAYLQAYADGVNAYLDGRDTSDISLEYTILGFQHSGYQPEPWTPVDSLAWLKAMAWDLRGNMEQEIARSLATQTLPVARVEQLYPPYPYDLHPTIVHGGTVTDGAFVPTEGDTAGGVSDSGAAGGTITPAADTAAVPPALPAGARPALVSADRVLAALGGILGPGGSGIGSNAWAVSGQRTASGRPILANDPHLAPAMPSIWYQAGLHCRHVSNDCPFDVVGYTFSGVPGVIIGHNQRIAWGFTNLGPDVSDLFVEQLDGDRYRTPDGWEPLETRTETIGVAGEDPVTLTVRSTRHGPLLSDVSDQLGQVADQAPLDARARGASYGVALRWTALDPGGTVNALFALDAARDFTEFRRAAAAFEVPAQNLVYADVDGNIGYQAPGRIPIRANGDGRWPVPGWTDEYAWTGTIPFAELPYALNPDRGFVVTANNAVIGPDYPYLLTDDWARGYRAERIEDLLRAAGGDLTVEDIARMQADTHDLNADVLVPRLLDVDVPDDVADAQQLLAGWDHNDDRDSAAAAFFNATWRHLLIRTFADELPDDVKPEGGHRWFLVVRGLLDDPTNPWWDDVTTDAVEHRDDMLRDAMEDAVAELRDRLGDDVTGWRWGSLHTLMLRNASLGESGIALVERLFNRGPYHVAGGTSIVDATAWLAADGYDVVAVPSMRMIVDLGDLDASRWINLTGNSGHAYHPNYVDQTPLWQNLETLPMAFTAPAVDDAANDRLVLRPAEP